MFIHVPFLNRLDATALSYHSWLEMIAVLFFLLFIAYAVTERK